MAASEAMTIRCPAGHSNARRRPPQSSAPPKARVWRAAMTGLQWMVPDGLPVALGWRGCDDLGDSR
jgi:hypothetical protein